MKILYILSNYNLYGGTPKKTLDLMNYYGEKSVLYVYTNEYSNLINHFKKTKASIYEGNYGRNIFKHINMLLKIIDKENIDIVQTQFSMGETLGFLIKIFRPKIKLIIAFVSVAHPSFIKSIWLNYCYRIVDNFVFISNYVKDQKSKEFPYLLKKKWNIIYNGATKRDSNLDSTIIMKKYSILDIAGLIPLKNIQILIEAFNILVNYKKRKDIFLYIAGDGPYRSKLDSLINTYNLQEYIFLLGYQLNVGQLLNDCDVFVHPSYLEGFGIVITEAMLAGKPIIVSNAGALPELIENEITGLIVEPHDSYAWANAILELIEDPNKNHKFSINAKTKAETEYSVEKFIENYNSLYSSLLEKM